MEVTLFSATNRGQGTTRHCTRGGRALRSLEKSGGHGFLCRASPLGVLAPKLRHPYPISPTSPEPPVESGWPCAPLVANTRQSGLRMKLKSRHPTIGKPRKKGIRQFRRDVLQVAKALQTRAPGVSARPPVVRVRDATPRSGLEAKMLTSFAVRPRSPSRTVSP